MCLTMPRVAVLNDGNPDYSFEWDVRGQWVARVGRVGHAVSAARCLRWRKEADAHVAFDNMQELVGLLDRGRA